jgi:hypothetical protein
VPSLHFAVAPPPATLPPDADPPPDELEPPEVPPLELPPDEPDEPAAAWAVTVTVALTVTFFVLVTVGAGSGFAVFVVVAVTVGAGRADLATGCELSSLLPLAPRPMPTNTASPMRGSTTRLRAHFGAGGWGTGPPDGRGGWYGGWGW